MKEVDLDNEDGKSVDYSYPPEVVQRDEAS